MCEILTIPEISKLLKISRSKAYALTKEQGFPIIRMGKSIRVIKSELLNWLHIWRKRYIIC